MKKLFSVASVLLLTLLVLGTTPAAKADLTLRLTDGTTTIDIGDSNSDGVIQWTGTIGAWDVSIDDGGITGKSDPKLPPPLPHMNLRVTGTANEGANLTVMLSENGFNESAYKFLMSLSGTVTIPTGSSVAYQSYYSTANTLYDLQHQIAAAPLVYNQTSTPELGGDVFSMHTSGIGIHDVPAYSVTQVVDFVLNGSGTVYQVNAGLQNSPVPEPASIAFLGTGLLGITFIFRKKRSRRAE